MNQNTSSASELIAQMVKQLAITKKLAAEILHAIVDVIEEGLKKDGEVRVRGLGTFRLRWTRGKIGRNPKTGERIGIPSHNRVVFLPEQAFKEYINRDNRLLSYKIIPSAEQALEQEVIEQDQHQYQYQEQYQPETEYLPEPEPKPEDVIKPEIKTETVLETPLRKRRIHWIVPVAISVVIVLSLVFYFRNFYHSSRQLTVDSIQQSAAERSDVPTQSGSAVSSQSTVEPTQNSELRTQNSELRTQNSELRTPNSALRTQHSELISEGTHLFRLAREIYGNPYLWVLIYKENQDKIPDPDMVISGNELLIPALNGKADSLSRDDSIAVSEGYRLVYEFYKDRDETRAKDCSRAMKQYRPKS